MDQSKLARCPNCNQIIVTWNWFGPLEQWDGIHTYTEYTHECWICDSTFTTGYEVTNGVPYEVCKILCDLHEAGEPVVYTDAMRLLYEPK